MENILLTGALGEVGSQIALELSCQGYRVFCLVRSKLGLSAEERLRQVFGSAIYSIEGNITEAFCGLSKDFQTKLRGSFSKLVHCAALVKFEKALQDDLYLTNVLGTKNVLDLATSLAIPEIHFVSTAYVAGSAQIFGENDVGLPENARNPYEETKQKAEALVRSSHKPFNIYRLSVVVGDSTRGEVDKFTGYYGYFSAVWGMREKLRQIASEKGFQMPTNLKSTINLVPRDWVREMLGKLISKKAVNQCFHLTHPRPPSVGWVLETSYNYLNLPVCPVEVYNPPRTISKEWQAIQRMILREVKKYNAYTEHEGVFSNHCLQDFLGSEYKNPAPIDQTLVHRLLKYAIRRNFGKKDGVCKG